MNFVKRLKSIGFNPNFYLNIVKEVAEEKGYNADNLTFSTRPDKKLMYRVQGKTIHFGATEFNDYIILMFEAHQELITERQADETRNRYLKRSEKIKGNWKNNDYSSNNLSRRILWASQN